MPEDSSGSGGTDVGDPLMEKLQDLVNGWAHGACGQVCVCVCVCVCAGRREACDDRREPMITPKRQAQGTKIKVVTLPPQGGLL